MILQYDVWLKEIPHGRTQLFALLTAGNDKQILLSSLYTQCGPKGMWRDGSAVKSHSKLVGSEESVDTYSTGLSSSHSLLGYDWGPTSVGGEWQA